MSADEKPDKEIDDKSLDTVEKDFVKEKRIDAIKQTLWQNKRVKYTLIAMGGLLMVIYIAWVVSS